jgi:hypothetical protein
MGEKPGWPPIFAFEAENIRRVTTRPEKRRIAIIAMNRSQSHPECETIARYFSAKPI